MNKTPLWKQDKQGNLVFPRRSGLIQDAYAVESFWERPCVSLFVLALCGIADFMVFSQLFALILYEHEWLQRLSVVGCLIAFDFGPVYLGMARRRSTQGLRADKLGCALLVAAFLGVALFNCYLRIMLRDQLVPSNSAAEFSLFSVMNPGSSPAALPYAVFSSVLPVATSIVSFFVSLSSCNPLKVRLKRLRRQQIELEDAICQVDAILAEYKQTSDLKTRLQKEDDAMYAAALAAVKEQGFYLADYVRERLKEHLGDPAALNELSKDHRSSLETLCRPTIAEVPVGNADTIQIKEAV